MDAWIDGLIGNSFELMIGFRILLSALFGAVIGIEREYYGRPAAGLRTHILVSVGSALVMCISIFGFESGDPARLAAQVISGIGFLGAGAIIQGDKDIKGLTTAATLWISAMIGLAAGNGFYFGVLIATVFSLIVLIVFRRFEHKINKSRSRVYATIAWQDDIMSTILKYIKECGLLVLDIESKIIITKKSKVS